MDGAAQHSLAGCLGTSSGVGGNLAPRLLPCAGCGRAPSFQWRTRTGAAQPTAAHKGIEATARQGCNWWRVRGLGRMAWTGRHAGAGVGRGGGPNPNRADRCGGDATTVVNAPAGGQQAAAPAEQTTWGRHDTGPVPRWQRHRGFLALVAVEHVHGCAFVDRGRAREK